MTSAIQHRTFFIRVLFFLVALCLLQTPATGQDNNAASLKEAISQLGQFQKDVIDMSSIVDKPLGPYTLSGQCTWCSYSLVICWENTTATFPGFPVDFSSSRRGLKSVLDDAGQNASVFSDSYAPTKAWINGLPEFSKKFDAAEDLILRVQQEIKAGSGPTDQQYRIVKQALQTLTDDLDRSSDQLNSGTTALAESLEQQSSYREKIRQAIGGADKSAQDALEVIKGHANNFAVVREHSECQGVFNEKFNVIRGDFSRSITEIDSAFKKLGDSSQKAQTSLAVLLGSVLDSRTIIVSVQNSLEAAKKDPLGSFLKELHLTAAKKQWKDLADSYVK